MKAFEFFGEIGIKTKEAEEGLRRIRDDAKESAGGMAISFKKAATVIGGALATLGAIDIGKKILGKGWDRLIGIDTATAKLTALGHSAQEVDVIMDNALQSVRGTAFGLESAATAAASAVAAGIEPGQELERYLSLVGDTAAIAGAGFEEMGSIFNKVMTSGVIQAEELNQLGDRGIPIFKMLADEMGVSQDQIRELASEGAISSEIFLAAIENGFGGAAKTMGELSLSAAIDNVWASVGRLGAAFLGAGEDGEGMFQQLKPLLGNITNWIDSLAPGAERLGASFGRMFTIIIEGFQTISTFINIFRDGESLENIFSLNHMGFTNAESQKIFKFVEGFKQFFATLKQPINNYINRLKKGLEDFFEIFSEIDFGLLIENVKDFAEVAIEVFAEVAEGIIEFLEPIQTYWKNTFDTIKALFKDLVRAFNQAMRGDWSGAFDTLKEAIGDALTGMGDNILEAWAGIWDNAKELITSIDWVGVGQSVMTFLGDALRAGVSWLGDIGTVIKGWISEKLGLEEGSSWSEIGEKIWENIKLGVDSALTSAGNIAETIRLWIADKMDMSEDSDWSDIGKVILTKIANGVTTATESVMEFLYNFLDVMNAQSPDAELIDSIVGKMLGAIATAIGGLGSAVLEILKAIVQGILNSFDDLDTSEWDPISKAILEGIKTALSNIWEFSDTITNMIEKFVEGVNTGNWQPLADAIENKVVQIIEDQFKKSFLFGNLIDYDPWFYDEPTDTQDGRGSGGRESNPGEVDGGGGSSPAIVSDYTEMASQASSGMAKVNQAIRQGYEAIRTTFDQMKTGMTNLMTQIMESILTPISPGMAKVNQAFRSGNEPIQTTLNGMGTAFSRIMTNIMTDLNKVVQDGMSSVTASFGSVIASVTRAGRDTGRGFYDGLASQMDRIIGLARDIADNVDRTIRRALDVRSPSRRGFDTLMNYGLGLYNGLASMKDKIWGMGREIAEGLNHNVEDNLNLNGVLKGNEFKATVTQENQEMSQNFREMNRKLDYLEQIYLKDNNNYMDSREVSKALVNPLEDERKLLNLLKQRQRGAW